MENFDIFNLGIDNFKNEETPVSKALEYKTDPKLSKDSIYRSIVRFVPNIKNPKKSIIKKYSYWLGLEDGEGFYIDCPSSIKEPSIIQDTFWKLYKSESAFDKKQAEHIKRKEYYYSYVEIVKDPQRPELEGTIQVFRYPKAVKKLIDAQIQPEATEIEMGAEPTNIFDFFNGKDFSLKVTIKGGYWNYEECKFAPTSSPISIKGVKMDNNAESRNVILALYEGVQDLDDFDFKPWNDEQRERVHKFLSELTGNPGLSYNSISANTNSAKKPKSPSSNEPIKTINNPSVIDEANAESSNGADVEIEDWLKEFNI